MSATTDDIQASLAAVSAARVDVLRALELLSGDRTAARAATDAVVSLQDAANQLGLIQRDLIAGQRPPASDVPPPILDPASGAENGDGPAWNGQALAVLALAESSVPYGSGPAGEVDSWLRVLRRESAGKVGQALAELGFPEGRLTARAETARSSRGLRAVEAVRSRATDLARRRRAPAVTTLDVLFAVLAEYPRPLVQHALYERGVTEDALLQHLASGGLAQARTASTIHAV